MEPESVRFLSAAPGRIPWLSPGPCGNGGCGAGQALVQAPGKRAAGRPDG